MSARLRLGRGRQQTLCKPQVDKRLHGLDIFVANEVEELADIDEVDEACIELLVGTGVPERVKPVAVVDVRVAPHHLSVDALDIALEILGEAGRLSQPVLTRKLVQRGVKTSWAQGLRVVGRGGHGARCVC